MTPPKAATQPQSTTGPVAGLPEPARRRRPLLVIVGVVVASVATALVALVLTAAGETTLVWSVAAPVTRGEVVAEADLEAVEVAVAAADGQVAATVESRSRLTSGQVWAADLPAGQLVSDALTVDQLPVENGRALVGVQLDPGGFPTAGLGPGDVVQVVAVGHSGDDISGNGVLVDEATVEAVVVLADQGPASPLLVTLDVPDERAAAVAAAGMDGRVSLVVVP